MLRLLILTSVFLGHFAMADSEPTVCPSDAPVSIEGLANIKIAAVSCNSDSDCPGGLSCIGLICRTP